MTQAQEDRILQKIKGIQPKEIKPYLQAIKDTISAKRLNVGQASILMNIIYDIHALDRNYNDDLDGTQRKALQDKLVTLLRDNMNPQTCELCKTGTDSLRFDHARVCQDCINKM